jgi:hypothetical protein
MGVSTERGLYALFILNVALQVFDGLATYLGLQAGFDEGNPLLAQAMTVVGPVSNLFLAKLGALTCLLWIWQLRRARLATAALVLTAVVYATCSLAPWSGALAQAHLVQSFAQS